MSPSTIVGDTNYNLRYTGDVPPTVRHPVLTPLPGEGDLGLVDALAQLTFAVQGTLGRIAAAHDLSIVQARLLGILRDRSPTIKELAQVPAAGQIERDRPGRPSPRTRARRADRLRPRPSQRAGDHHRRRPGARRPGDGRLRGRDRSSRGRPERRPTSPSLFDREPRRRRRCPTTRHRHPRRRAGKPRGGHEMITPDHADGRTVRSWQCVGGAVGGTRRTFLSRVESPT